MYECSHCVVSFESPRTLISHLKQDYEKLQFFIAIIELIIYNNNEDSPIFIKNIISFSSAPLHKYLLNNKKHCLRFIYL